MILGVLGEVAADEETVAKVVMTRFSIKGRGAVGSTSQPELVDEGHATEVYTGVYSEDGVPVVVIAALSSVSQAKVEEHGVNTIGSANYKSPG